MPKKKQPRHHAERFDFDLPRNLGVLICRRVSTGTPVQQVFHDADGDWQFLCDGDHSEDPSDQPLVVCIEDVVAQDQSLNELATLDLNHSAVRSHPGQPWTVHDDHEDFIREAVDEHGWAVQLIPAGDSQDEPSFAYTAGLWLTHKHPEIIVFGLSLEQMHDVLNLCGDRVKETGKPLPIDEPISGLIEGQLVKLRQVREKKSYEDHVAYASWLHDGADFPLLQLVWPDDEGRFPDDETASIAVRSMQPLIA